MIQDNKKVWDMLLSDIKNEYGVAGIMGNLQAESCIRSNNLQNTGNTALGLTDEEYTLQVDTGNRNFIDNRGYGIAQWTSGNRKQRLLNYCKNKGVSISDLIAQVEYLLIEMKTYYPKVYEVVKNAKTVEEASTYFMKYYEVPASKDKVEFQKARASKGEVFYNEYHVVALGQPNSVIEIEVIVKKDGVEIERKVINVS